MRHFQCFVPFRATFALLTFAILLMLIKELVSTVFGSDGKLGSFVVGGYNLSARIQAFQINFSFFYEGKFML